MRARPPRRSIGRGPRCPALCPEGKSMKNASSLRRPWAALLALGLMVATVLMACGADTRSNAGAGAAAPAEIPATMSGAASPALRASYLAVRQHEGGPAYRFERTSRGATAKNAAHQVDVEVAGGAASVTGARASGNAWRLGLRWTGVG